MAGQRIAAAGTLVLDTEGLAKLAAAMHAHGVIWIAPVSEVPG